MKNYKELLVENRAWAEETFKKIDKKMSAVTLRSRNKLPDGVDKDGVHIDLYTTNKNGWTAGFWGSLNAILYEYTKNEEYLKTAKASAEMLSDALQNFDLLDHDVGFIYHLVFSPLYRITGDNSYRVKNLFAAATLASRFVDGPNFIRAWNPWCPGDEKAHNWSIIDCLMNLPLLYWASRDKNDDRFTRIAEKHADMALRAHLRPDGSVAHIVEHSRETGEVVKTYGGQGYKEGSSWSRGQAWALYGFALSYIHTGEVRYLDAAKQVANYFIANVCDDWLPRVDFRSPSEPVYYDSTAGACAACGLLELARHLPEDEGGMYANAAINILRAEGEHFANFDPNRDDMIGFGSIRYPSTEVFSGDAGLHKSIIYADLFYTEAILKLLGSDFSPWA
ncbi:MAG: glycoside hydrolase family 88 protein [Clostridia bacterium]|nr:glycoside hydrolase family 88 protein [Clostridia bacterium]